MGRLKDALLPQPASFVKKKNYELLNVLGTGTFGKVIEAKWHPPGLPERPAALKVVPKKLVKGGSDDAIFTEMKVLDGLDHPNIVSGDTSVDRAYVLKLLSRSNSMNGSSLETSTTSHSSWPWVGSSSNESPSRASSLRRTPSTL